MITIVNSGNKNTDKRPIVQVCFSIKGDMADAAKREEKLREAKGRLDKYYGEDQYLVMSCHLSREICENAGFNTEVPDAFDKIFGEGNYMCELNEHTLDEAKKNMQMHREALSMKADRLVVMSDTPLTNVALEIELFTMNKVMIV